MNRFHHPDPIPHRKLRREKKRAQVKQRNHHDDAVLNATGIRELRSKPVFTTPNYFPPANKPVDTITDEPARETIEPQHCYVCKEKYTRIHHFYDQMCPACAEFNYRKRTEANREIERELLRADRKHTALSFQPTRAAGDQPGAVGGDVHVGVAAALGAQRDRLATESRAQCGFLSRGRLRFDGADALLDLRVQPTGVGDELLRPPVPQLVGVAEPELRIVLWHVQQGAIDLFIADASFDPPGGSGGAGGADELRAPFNGKVIAIKARPGATVARGDTLLVLESMKLEHALGASRDGVIKSVHVEPGQQAATSQVLVTFEALQ